MLVLHAALRDDGLEVWAEGPAAEPSPSPSRPRGRARRRAASSPYDAGEAVLAAALTGAGVPAAPEPRAAVAWLPTVEGAPVASSALIAEPPPAGAAPALAPWTV